MRYALLSAVVVWSLAAWGELPPLDEKRVAEIASWLPEKAVGLGRPIGDRAAWEKLSQSGVFKSSIADADRIIAAPIPDQPEELYLDFSKTGNRDRYQKVAFGRRDDLCTLVLAECATNQGKYLPRIADLIDALCAERTWVWPAHDRSLVNFNGKAVEIDLGAAELGWQMSTARWLLQDRLPQATREKIQANVNRRIIEPYLAWATGKARPIGWMSVTNNWNAVCHAGVVGACLASVDDPRTRAIFIASAERGMRPFLAGFTPDGYCSEGLGYWNYGFGHFVSLTETVYQATGGRVDFMKLPGAAAPATFAPRITIINGVAPAFADCPLYPKPYPQIMWYLNKRFSLGLKEWDELNSKMERNYLSEAVMYRFMNGSELPLRGNGGREPLPQIGGLRTWFDSAGILIGRPAPGGKLGVALKGGHNAEHHNHNDLGTFVVVVGERNIIADPAGERYTARTFSAKRYDGRLLNSYGHPVPVVAGQLQQPGAKARAKVLQAEFTDEKDTLSFDLTSAYPVPELVKLQRTFVYSRQGAGSLTVTDQVSFKSPQSFESALITLGTMKREGEKIVLEDGSAVEITIDSGGAKYTLSSEEIIENAVNKPLRIAIKLDEKVTEATVRMTIVPK